MSFLQNLLYILLTKIDYYVEGTYTQHILFSAWSFFARLWPFVVAGIIGSALLSVVIPKEKIRSVFEDRGAVSIVLASGIGLISPFGAYSTIPLCAALMMAGIPPAPLVAFLVSSPLMNPNLFFITSGALGFEMAILRAVSALVLGLAAGGTTQFLVSFNRAERHWFGLMPSQHVERIFSPEKRERDKARFHSAFTREVVTMSRFVGRYLLPSILLASVIGVCVPPIFISRILGSGNFLSVLVATGAGVPLYVCGGAAIPVVQELHSLGMSKGAMMAFFIAGPATKLSTLIALKAVFRTPFFLIYITVTIVGALVIGYLCNVFL
jgi:uncharacterized membrane protein YraQ (UPF0718 family)